MSYARPVQARRITRKERNKWRKLVSHKEILPSWHAVVPLDKRLDWTPPPQPADLDLAEALRTEALALIASVEGAKRRGFARREVVEGFTSREFGYVSGRLLVLTPLGAMTRDVQIAERTERAVVEERVKKKRQKGSKKKVRETHVLLANAEIPFWTRVMRDETGKAILPRRKRKKPKDYASDAWLKLIEDYRGGAEAE